MSEPSAPIHAAIRTVLERSGEGPASAEILAALERSPRRAEAERLLAARHPKSQALPAFINGTVCLRDLGRGRVELTLVAPEGTYKSGAVDRDRLIVSEGDPVQVGDPLTDGELSLQSILDVFGTPEALERLTAQFQEVLGLSLELAATLAQPMLSLVALVDRAPPEGMRSEFLASEAWLERLQAAGIYCFRSRPVLTGYPQLLVHVDPPAEPYLARDAADRALAQKDAAWEATRPQREAEEAARQAAEDARRAAALVPPDRRGEKFEDEVIALALRDGVPGAIKRCRSAGFPSMAESKDYVIALLRRRRPDFKIP
ncbi:MAG: hypothetical protein QM765_34520 [Myxococcales bacterium]